VTFTKIDEEPKYRKIMELQKEKDSELKGILTETQFEKYTEKRDEMLWKAMKEYFFG
jgi:hypothetical protein